METKKSQHIPEKIIDFCGICSEGLAGNQTVNEQVDFVSQVFPNLARNGELFAEILSNLVTGKKYPDLWQATMFDNELVLYTDPNRLYSLRLFLWEPGRYTEVHDHGSWGVIGPVSGKLEVIDYDRLDDGSEEGRAQIVERERSVLVPGETAFTVPLDAGIHKIGNPTPNTMASLNVYGKPLERGYVLGFDIENGRTFRILPPTLSKKLLAIAALPSFDTAMSKDALSEAAKHPLEIVRNASRESSKTIS